jgi:lipid A 3-O-deacylase
MLAIRNLAPLLLLASALPLRAAAHFGFDAPTPTDAALRQPSDLVPTLDIAPTSAPAPEQPVPPDHTDIANISLYFENDGTFVRPGGTDKHYTSGEGFSVAYQPQWARTIANVIPSFGDNYTRFAVGSIFAQDIYTPADYNIPVPDRNDRPYAGYLYAGPFLQRSTAYTPTKNVAWEEHFELDLGMVGHDSIADSTQKGVHSLFGANYPRGWVYQVPDEFEFDPRYERRYKIRLDLPQWDMDTHDDWGIELLPDAGLRAGTLQRYLNADLGIRIGFNLPDDFGPGRFDDVADFTAPAYTHDFGFYVFARGGGRLVEHNVLLQGPNFSSYDRGVGIEPFFVELQGGVAIQFLRLFQLTYSQTLTSEEFRGQAGPDAYGSLQLSISFAF